MMSNTLDLVQPISGKHNSAERDATTNRTCTCSGNCHWCSLTCGRRENFCYLIRGLRKDNAIRGATGHKAGVGEKVTKLILIGFTDHEAAKCRFVLFVDPRGDR